MNVELIENPTEKDWMIVKELAVGTMGLKAVNPPTEEWKHKILKARHPPIRWLRWLIVFEDIPYYVSTHLSRHKHAQPFIETQRNDRQDTHDRRKAPQDYPVIMRWEVNAEELMIIANKRLCMQADPVTRKYIEEMCDAIVLCNPEMKPFLVPMCEYTNDCKEIFGCGRY